MQTFRVEMNYLKVYCNLIRKAENRGYTKKKAKEFDLYVEGHHTFPVSIFGKNKRIVYLTAREHYIAHALLRKIYVKRYGIYDIKSKKMIYAFWRLNNETKYNTYFNSRLYEKIKVEFIKLMTEDGSFSKNNPSKSAERKKELSERMTNYLLSLDSNEYKNRYKNRIERTKKIFTGNGNPFYGKTHSKKIKKLLSTLSSGTKWWNNGKENRRCKKCPGDGWVLGMYYKNNPLKGRTRSLQTIEKVINSNCKYIYTFINPTGNIFVTKNSRQFCLNNNLSPSKISLVVNGKSRQHKGWSVSRTMDDSLR